MLTEMKHRITALLFLLISIACQRNTQAPQGEVLFDENWKFFLGNVIDAENPSFNDESWRQIDLPHDWSIEKLKEQDTSYIIGPFSMEMSQGKRATGYVVGGTAWYRKHFVLNKKDEGNTIKILFDGVYMNADFWINGKYLGNHPYGYTSFLYDLTPFLNPAGKDNVLAVQVKNEGKNSRWYSGSGIYRHVWLIKKQAVHIPQNGVFITTRDVSGSKARVSIAAVVEKTLDENSEVKLSIKIMGPNGEIAQRTETQAEKMSSDSAEFVQDIIIPRPELWSPDSPNLYTAEIQVIADGVVTDNVHISFGIRTIHFSALDGFMLNGKRVLLKGGCLHHDNGFLGSATIDRAEERRVELMKLHGFNAIRTSHNPPSKQFLDACDRIGVLVIDEAFDTWTRPKNPEDYNLYFNDWWRKDLESMILRDRNHPSVISWSIGNEISERADTIGYALTKKLANEVRRLDPTRPVTEAICGFWDHPGQEWSTTAPAFATLDVSGYNYLWNLYESDHALFPDRIMMGTESFPVEAYECWQQVENHPWVIGDFVWTAMDYLGEAALGNSRLVDTVRTNRRGPSRPVQWPDYFNAFCGDIDLCGMKKPQLLYRDVVWENSRLEMVVHSPIPDGKREIISLWGWPDESESWNWEGNEGKMMNVRVFTRYPVIRIELNGKTIDEKTVSDTSGITVSFKVPYEPGILKAIAEENGKEITSKTLKTSGAPAKVKLVADRIKINADRNDLSYVIVEIKDDQDNLVPNASIPVSFTVSGAGEIAGSGNASPNDMESFNNPVCKTYRGRALVILRPVANKKKGTIILRAEADGITPGEISISVH
jgi:beta-galactosidase